MTVIVGAGAAGLSLGLMLDDVTIFEKENTAGGLCRSWHVDGFTFDRGPHILGGIPDAVDWILAHTPIDWHRGETRNRGWLDGAWVSHPFANAEVGYAYMAKMWKHDPEAFSLPGLGAQAGRKPGGVKEWRYPLRGGYQAITDAWAEKLADRIHYRVLYNAKATECDVWTAPLVGERYNSLGVVTMGFEGVAPGITAAYLPEAWTPFHRLSFPGAFSPHNCPKGYWSVQGEVSFAHTPDWFDLPGWLTFTLQACGITSREPVMVHQEIVPHAYPVPMQESVTGLHNECIELGESSTRPVFHGRTGGHRYLNVDGVVAASMALAQTLA